MVEDGDDAVYPTERAELWVAGWERVQSWGSIRAETYRRRVMNPRPRYESLFKPYDAFPEGEIDRWRIAADRSDAHGVELSLRNRSHGRTSWWVNYTWSESTDHVEGEDVPRRFDQRHALNLDVNRRFWSNWNVNAALLYHSGWPVTPVEVANGEANIGPRNSERLPGYARVDLRISRTWQRARDNIVVFADAQNLFARENVSGLDLALENGQLVVSEEFWPSFAASAGIIWEWRCCGP
jgi:outer membrane cobalamin receptor